MAMIQGIDGSALLQAFRQGRQDRYADEDRAISQEQKQIALDKQRQETGLIGQLFGSRGTVASQYASPAPQTAKPQSFDQAFSAPAMDTIASGGTPPPAVAPTAPLAAPQEPPRAAYDPDIMRKLIVINPEKYGPIASAFKAMDESALKQNQAKNDSMGSAAYYLSRFSGPERQAAFAHVAPALLQAGWSQQEIQRAAGDLSDQALQGYQAVAIDFDKMIDNELAQRQFEAGKSVAVAPGGNVAIIKPDGSAKWAIGGGAPSGSAAPPKAAADYLRRHPELRGDFDEKYGAGAADSILGGGASDGTGGFQD